VPRGVRTDRPGAGGHLSDAPVIRRVETRQDLDRFIDLPYQLHRRDLNWVPPLRAEVRKLLDRHKNPFFQHAEADYFLAERDGAVVGRIAAIHNRLHNETHDDRVGFFGFFESINDFRVASALLDTASAWVRARGLDTLRGPTSFSTNDECGLLISGFDTPNTVMMPHNPPYYLTLLETAGFTKAKDLIALEGGSAAGPVTPPERTTRAVDLLLKRYGITFRPLDMSDFKAEVERVKVLYNACWEKNWGFVPMTGAEIDKLAADFRPVIVAGMVPFAEKDGVPIGFGMGIPDLNESLRTNRSGRMFPGALKMMWDLKRRKLTRSRILLLGVRPEWRGKGLDNALCHRIWVEAGKIGIGWGEGGWVLEDNPAMMQALKKNGFVEYKTYRLLDRPA
jgi:GNAT superfamily N-acetyltransferase